MSAPIYTPSYTPSFTPSESIRLQSKQTNQTNKYSSNRSLTESINDKTNLQEYYPLAQDLPPLLICNQNQTERIQNSLLTSSVLLQGEDINISNLNKDRNNAIYERNTPSKPLSVNIDSRPVSSNTFMNDRFIKEQEELVEYNKYKVNLDCAKSEFTPGRGTINKFFDNIDLDSDLKNINEIDTRCSEKLFKIDPRKDETKLSCYTDTLIKDYKKLEDQVGYQWCDYNRCSNLKGFPKCDSESIKCPPKNRVEPTGEEIKEYTMLAQENERKERFKNDMLLLHEKMLLTNQNNLDRNNMQYKTPRKPDDIVQFKGDKVTNIYAPIVREQKVNIPNAFNLGKQKAYEIRLDSIIDERIKTIEEQNGIRKKGYNPNPEHNIQLKPVKKPEMYPFQCREQTRNLYKFQNMVCKNNDNFICEQLFNNSTKRKHLNVSRVPEHILNQD